jgi:hypothetical protein
MTSSGIVLGISSRMKILFMVLNLDRKLRYTSFRLIIACIEGKITESFSRKKRNNKMKQEPYRIKYLHTANHIKSIASLYTCSNLHVHNEKVINSL